WAFGLHGRRHHGDQPSAEHAGRVRWNLGVRDHPLTRHHGSMIGRAVSAVVAVLALLPACSSTGHPSSRPVTTTTAMPSLTPQVTTTTAIPSLTPQVITGSAAARLAGALLTTSDLQAVPGAPGDVH